MKSFREDFFFIKNHKLSFTLAWILLLLGLLTTFFVSYYVKSYIDKDNQEKFEKHCDEIRTRIEIRLEAHKQTLLSGAAMFDASNYVERKEWTIYVNRLRLDKHFDGIQALGFSLWIKPEELAAHEKSIQKEGFPDYHIKPAGKRDAYTSIIYIEPFSNRNLRAFSYDMYSEPVRRDAMQRAVDNNEVSLSGKVLLVQETSTDIQAGTLMYCPVYKKNQQIETVAQRRNAIFGWVYSPFRMTDLFQNIVSNDHDFDMTYLHMHVYDGNDINEEKLLYQNKKDSPNDPPVLFQYKTQLNFYGAIWTINFQQFPNPINKINYREAWITLVTGVSIGLLLFSLLRSYAMTRMKASSIAFDLTKQLREKERKLALVNADLLQFTTISTHHLQEPARRLVSFSKRLQDELARSTNANEEVAIALQFIMQSAERQQALVRDIQLYLAAPTPRGEVELVSVTDVIEKVIQHHESLIREIHAQIVCDTLPSVIIDKSRLYNIFNLLVDNSLRYRRLDCALKIRIYGVPDEARIRYYVEDNGIGIPAEYREKVFLVFERLQVNEDQNSTGIGLAIVRRIVESCDGAVNLVETAGGGTTVVFDLPTGL